MLCTPSKLTSLEIFYGFEHIGENVSSSEDLYIFSFFTDLRKSLKSIKLRIYFYFTKYDNVKYLKVIPHSSFPIPAGDVSLT